MSRLEQYQPITITHIVFSTKQRPLCGRCFTLTVFWGAFSPALRLFFVEGRFCPPFGGFGVSRNTLTLFREIKSAIRSVLGTLCGAVRFCPYLSAFLWYRRFNLDFRTCVSLVRFVLSVRVLFAPAAQRGLCPHALRAPLQGLLALDLGKGLTPPLASGVDVLQSASAFYFACGQFTLFYACSDVLGFGGAVSLAKPRPHRRGAAAPSILSANLLVRFRIPNSELTKKRRRLHACGTPYHFAFSYFVSCQMYLAYSSTARSAENIPAPDIFIRLILDHFSASV